MSLERAIEYTMTHRMGAAGVAERYMRPEGVRAIADRLRRWAGAPESCSSCQARAAASLRGGVALCGACRQTYDERPGRLLDAAGRPAAQFRADDAPENKQFRGHAIVFNVPSVDLGGFTEIIRPSAADRLMREAPDVRALWNHDSSIPLGRSTAGTLRYAKVTRGVSVEIDPPRWAHGHIESVERRDVSGMSFAFSALDDNWHLEGGDPVREVLDMRVYEFSGVTFPAYPQTDFAVVSANARSAWERERDSAVRVRMAR